MQNASWSRITHCDEVFEIGKKYDVKVIEVNLEKLQIGVSLKDMEPDPFEKIGNYEVNKIYQVKVDKITEFGAFCSLETGLTTLLHNSELSYTKKNASAKKMLKVGQEISCVITDINRESRRIAISYKLTQENPFTSFSKKYSLDTVCEGIVVSKNEYSLFIKIGEFDISCFCHCSDLTYSNDGEKELEKYKIGSKIQVKIVDIKIDEQKVRVSHRATLKDPFSFFKDKEKGGTITAKVVSTDNKNLTVRPEGCDLDFQIKKSEIALNAADQRTSRWTGGEKVDVGIKELQYDKRKVTLSIRYLEEQARDVALKNYGSTSSGKNLPFSNLSDKLSKAEDSKKKKKTSN